LGVRFDAKDPPRKFTVGNAVEIEIRDCGSIRLEADEQVTFVTAAGGELDVARKDWGFYATPSLNGRLQNFGLRGVLIRNRLTDRYFVLLVEQGREAAFDAYLAQEQCDVIAWLDTTEALTRLRAALAGSDARAPV
jgi:hypothetical protein